MLSGGVDAVEALLDRWQVPRARDASDGAIQHPSLVYVLDAQARIAFASTGGADELTALLARLREPEA